MQHWGINKVGNQFTELCSENLTALTRNTAFHHHSRRTLILAYQSELQEEDQSSGIIQQKTAMGT